MSTERKVKYPCFASIARDQQTIDAILAKGHNALFVEQETPVLLPANEKLNLRDTATIDKLCNFDVVELNSDTTFYIAFSYSVGDNALFITNKCNSSCIMCPNSDYERKKTSDRSPERILELISYFPKDAPYLIITGGEPTIIGYKFIDILKQVDKHFPETTQLTILTNGRSLAIKDFADKLLDVCPERTCFAIPIHGGCAEDHDAITQAKGSFDQTVVGVKRLLSCGFKVEIRIVVTGLNYQHMTDIADFIIKNFPGVSHVHIMAAEMRGSAVKNRDRVWVDYADCFSASREAIQMLMQNGFDVKLFNFPLCKVDRAYWPICVKSITDYKIQYYDTCSGCSVQQICGGVFGTTLKVTKMELTPIAEETHA